MLTTCNDTVGSGANEATSAGTFLHFDAVIDAHSIPLAGSILSEVTSAAASVFTVVTCMLLFNTLDSIF